MNYSVIVFSNGAAIRNSINPCVSSLCSYTLPLDVSNNTTYFTASVASINGDNAEGTRSLYTIGRLSAMQTSML